MKRLILISAFFAIASTVGFAQSENNGTPKEVRDLGRNPEFPMIRNCRTPEQVVTTLKKYGNSGSRRAHELNKALMDIGFANGVNDLTADNIVAARVPAETKGNMGDGSYNSNYIVLNAGDANGTKAWKITSPNGGMVYFLGRCGNTFIPEKTTACLTVPLNLTGDTKEVTLDNSSLRTGKDRIFVYYHRRKHKRHMESFANANIPDGNPSRPLLLSQELTTSTQPATYKISVSSPNTSAYVCPDKELDINTNINVERESEFTGNYPGTTDQYKRVSKHAYKKAERKMAKVRRKERKIERATSVDMNA